MGHILIIIIILNILLIHFLVVNTTFYFSKVVLNEVVEVVEMFIFPTCVALVMRSYEQPFFNLIFLLKTCVNKIIQYSIRLI
jgi:hypothetical protein